MEYSKDENILLFQNKVKKYIDWYNNVRIQKRLDNMSPVQFRFSMQHLSHKNLTIHILL